MRAAALVLAGRDQDLALLTAALTAARNGRPQVVFVEGEPGVGKSALIDAFLRGQPKLNVAARVSCDQFEQNLAFGVAGLLLDRWLSDTNEVEVGRQLLSWFSDVQSEDQAVVVVIDDAQWLDRPSAQALRLALRRLRADSVLTIMARRPAGSDDFWQGFSGSEGPATSLRLRSLTLADVRQLAAETRSWTLSQAAADHVVSRTGGLPLLVEAVIRDAVDVDDLTSQRVPASAADATQRMLSSIDEPARLLVEAAAVLAEPADLLALGRVAGVSDPAAAGTAGQEAGLLRADIAGRLTCGHALLRDAVLGAVPRQRRQAMHRRAAEWAGSDRRLGHRVAAADQPDPALLADLLRAANHAAGLGRRELAATYRLQARTVCTDPQQRDDLLVEALIDRVEGQDIAGAQMLAVTAQQSGPGPLRSLGLGLLARETGQVAEARTLLGHAMAQAAADGDETLAARAGLAAGSLHVALNEGTEAIAATRTALTAHDPRVAGDAATVHGLGQWQSGDLHGALRFLAAVPTSRDGLPWEVDLLSARGMVQHYAGDLTGAVTDLDAALARRHLWRRGSNLPRTYVQRSMTRYNLGDWDGATVDAAAAVAVAEGLTQPWSMPLAHAISAQVPASRGQWELAAEHLATARAGMAQAPSTQVAGVSAAVQVLLATAQEDYATVRTILAPLQSSETLRRLALVRSFRWVSTGWISACTELGDIDAADSALNEYEALLRRWPEGPIATRLGLLKGRLAEVRGDAAAARGHYADDLADPQLLSQPFLHAQVLHTAGRLERALGNRRAAIDHLLRAQQILTALRATPFLTRCTTDLVACGLRGDTADPLALTEREEDVAALVSRGLTNKEIGAELFLTVKTVEYHLSNIYTKLGISGRRELRLLRGP